MTWKEAHQGRVAGSAAAGDRDAVEELKKLDDVVNRLIDEEPAVFQIRTPAPLPRRIGAGLLDFGTALVIGATVALPPFLLDAVSADTSALALVFVVTGVWSVRDAATREGNRSWGKKKLGLELVQWDGALPSRGAALFRNMYWWLFPFALFNEVRWREVRVAVRP